MLAGTGVETLRAHMLFAGDLNVDIQMTDLRSPMETDHEVFCDGFTVAVGGSTAIAAAAYTRLGGDAELCAVVGDDDYGRFLAARLREAGLGLRLLRSITGRPTGVTVNIVYGSTRSQVTYPGTLALADESEVILRELHRFSHVHVSGPYGTPRFLPRIRAIMREARVLGLTTSLDTQWDATQKWKHLKSWLPHLSYLFLNRDEALAISGTTGVESAWRALAESTACPIIKLGPRGAYAAGRRQEAFAIDVVDPTGAGDVFAAGFLYALHVLGMTFDPALRFAVAAGALACTYEGGVSPLLTRRRVTQMLEAPPSAKR
jgi:sugar/nucleoside kinase (ribokinase family)